MTFLRTKVTGCLVGLACGDAVGTTLEFLPRGSFTPIEDMVGGGPFNLEKGQWTDDTSMALCLGNSLGYVQGFDPIDQMNRYCNWYRYGYMSSTSDCFDIGITVSKALKDYLATGDPFSGSSDEFSSGNGALMRLAPIPMYYRNHNDDALHFAGESTRTTHGSALCIDSSKLFCDLLIRAMYYDTKDEVLATAYTPYNEAVSNIAKKHFLRFSYEELTGSGFVIESLESALWCFYHGNSFRECVLLAANIGNDADTTAAICGQIAGAFYGIDNIPKDWIETLTDSEEIVKLANELYELGKEEKQMNTVTCYRPTGQNELDLVAQTNYKKWPPRLPEQPIFYPVTNEEYAKELTQWNVSDFGIGYVTKFEVKKDFMDRFPIKTVGARSHTEWWVPAEELDSLNDNIVGVIEVIGTYR